MAPPVIAAGLLRDMRAAGQVTAETLSGVLSIYLLAGMFFSFAFAAVGALGDEPFFAEVANPNRSDYLYFSYTTLTTTGFGTSPRPPRSGARWRSSRRSSVRSISSRSWR